MDSCFQICYFVFAGGAGGKGVWGKLGDELYVNGVADERDPNYDSDTTVSVELLFPNCFVSHLSYDQCCLRHRRLF